MRTFYLILSFVCLCDLLHAQTVRIAYEGDPLTDKERQKIELTLQYEVEFYSQFGLPDTLNLKLTVFNKREDALVYLNKFNIHPPKSTNGIYISRLQKAIILSREKEYQQGLGVIYHELSHHLTLQITAGRPPISVSYTNLRAHETVLDLVCRLLLEKKNDTDLIYSIQRTRACIMNALGIFTH